MSRPPSLYAHACLCCSEPPTVPRARSAPSPRPCATVSTHLRIPSRRLRESLDFWSFPALGDAQGAVWCKSLFRLIFRNLCRYRSALTTESLVSSDTCAGRPPTPRPSCGSHCAIDTWADSSLSARKRSGATSWILFVEKKSSSSKWTAASTQRIGATARAIECSPQTVITFCVSGTRTC